MKFLILICLIASVYCTDDCNTSTENNGRRLVVDARVNDVRQSDCVRKILTNTDQITEVEINIGDCGGTQRVTMDGTWMTKMMTACDKTDIDRVTVNMRNVQMTGDTTGCTLTNVRELRFNLRTTDDCYTCEKILTTLQTRKLRTFEIFTDTDTEVDNGFEFCAKTRETLGFCRLNSKTCDFQSNRDTFILKTGDTTRTITSDKMKFIRKIREAHDRQAGDCNKIREVTIRCGNDMHDFDFIFMKEGNERNMRRIKTNLDLTTCNRSFDKVWRLGIRDMDMTETNMRTLQQTFKNVRKITCTTTKTRGMDDDQRTTMRQIFGTTDRRLECTTF